MKRNQKVTINRKEIHPDVAEILGTFILCNEGRVTKVDGKRIEVRWYGNRKFWLDEGQLKRV